jgi:hypothetical protein
MNLNNVQVVLLTFGTLFGASGLLFLRAAALAKKRENEDLKWYIYKLPEDK